MNCHQFIVDSRHNSTFPHLFRDFFKLSHIYHTPSIIFLPLYNTTSSYFILLNNIKSYIMLYCKIWRKTTMKPKKSKVSITLDLDIIEKITEMADNNDRSFSQYINMVLKDYISKTVDANTSSNNI